MGKRKRTSGDGSANNHNHKRKAQTNGNHASALNFDEDDAKPAGGLFSGLSTGKIDPNYNQRGAFPGLDEEEEDGFVGPALDGMQYLRMVRSEAKGVPSLLMANPPDLPPRKRPRRPVQHRPAPAEELCYDDAPEATMPPTFEVKDEPQSVRDEWEAEESGYYVDGAYIARPDQTRREYVASTPSHPSLTTLLPRAVSREWHTSLLNSFIDLREKLQKNPLPSPANFQPIVKHEEWMRATQDMKPTMSQIFAMSRQDVMRGLRVQEKFLKLGRDVGQYQGCWLYGLLLRCEDVGVLANEDVSILRDLGKRALVVLGSWSKLRLQERVEEQETEELGRVKNWWRDAVDAHDALNEDQVLDATVSVTNEPKIDNLAINKSSVLFRPRSTVISKSTNVITKSQTVENNSLETTLEDSSVEVVQEQVVQEVKGTSAGSTTQNIEEDFNAPQSPDRPNKLPELILDVDGEVIAKPVPVNPFKRDAQSEADKPKRPSPETIYTLDMVLSIVGDFFGQKDLLLERV